MPEIKAQLVPYGMVTPGFEAVYTQKKPLTQIELADEYPSRIFTDASGNTVEKWSLWTWLRKEDDWDAEIQYINQLQKALGPINDEIRQIRAHIASLVLCDSGVPVTLDELLDAIGSGKLKEPSFHNGCWMGGMWWSTKTSQPSHQESMRTIDTVLKGYLVDKKAEYFIQMLPHAVGFIHRTFNWLGPQNELTHVQKLMLQRMLLCFDYFTQVTGTLGSAYTSKELQLGEKVLKNCFQEGGEGTRLDEEISKLAKLPRIFPIYRSEFQQNLDQIKDPQKRDLYKVCCHIAHGICTLSDCHHNAFRNIENWIYGIGTGKWGIPARKAGTERKRLGQLFFGYVLALDTWLMNKPMQFVLLDLGHIDLGFDPKNEIIRVYAYLGEERSQVKKWLAASLWYTLMYHPLYGNPAGLAMRHQDIMQQALAKGIKVREWMDSVLFRQNFDYMPKD
jgi:hypothetical protein